MGFPQRQIVEWFGVTVSPNPGLQCLTEGATSPIGHAGRENGFIVRGSTNACRVTAIEAVKLDALLPRGARRAEPGFHVADWQVPKLTRNRPARRLVGTCRVDCRRRPVVGRRSVRFTPPWVLSIDTVTGAPQEPAWHGGVCLYGAPGPWRWPSVSARPGFAILTVTRLPLAPLDDA